MKSYNKFNKIYLETINEMNKSKLNVNFDLQSITTVEQAENYLMNFDDKKDQIIICLKLRIAKPKLAQQLRISFERSYFSFSETEDENEEDAENAEWFDDLLAEVWGF